jgi:glucose dehydrogenase
MSKATGSGLKRAAVRIAPHKQGDQHSGFETLSCHIAGDDEQASIEFVRNGLKEVATHLAGRSVLALNDESGKVCTRLGKHDLLHLLSLSG